MDILNKNLRGLTGNRKRKVGGDDKIPLPRLLLEGKHVRVNILKAHPCRGQHFSPVPPSICQESTVDRDDQPIPPRGRAHVVFSSNTRLYLFHRVIWSGSGIVDPWPLFVYSWRWVVISSCLRLRTIIVSAFSGSSAGGPPHFPKDSHTKRLMRNSTITTKQRRVHVLAGTAARRWGVWWNWLLVPVRSIGFNSSASSLFWEIFDELCLDVVGNEAFLEKDCGKNVVCRFSDGFHVTESWSTQGEGRAEVSLSGSAYGGVGETSPRNRLRKQSSSLSSNLLVTLLVSMEGRLDSDELLDYAVFQISPVQNRYDAFVCSKGKTERLDSGILEQLVAHLRSVNFEELGNSFKLELPEGIRSASWFNKSTLSRFLHIVGAPLLWKNVNAILDEVSQLEDARQFHLTLYTHGPQSHSQNEANDGDSRKEREPSLNPGVGTESSDATKNELLRAMDLRLTALRTELVAALERAAGATCSTEHVTFLDEFARHFGATDIRNSLSKYLALGLKKQPTDPVNNDLISVHDLRLIGNMTEGTPPTDLQVEKSESTEAFVSPAKVVELEHRSLTESESSSSSEDNKSHVERSRSLVRSASPRRSASPMRRVQIGRSGSRRATAIAIKSLGFIPAREKLLSNRNAFGNSSEDEDADQPAKKPESTVRRMSVQDAINLFESKQRDQRSEIQKLRSSTEISGTNKSVLRRWSAGMGDSPTQSGPDTSQVSSVPCTDDNAKSESQRSSDFVEPNVRSDVIETPNAVDSSAADEKAAFDDQDLGVAGSEEIHNKVSDSVEWTRQKEAELNQMLMKMMESKPNRYGVAKKEKVKEAVSGERRGSFYDHYREKRDEKLRGENAGKRAQKEAQFKAIHDMLDQRKAEMTPKNVSSSRKQDSPSVSRNARRTSSPPVGPKKEPPSKPAGLKRASTKSSSPLPATRSSWPSTPSPRSIAPSPAKTSGVVSSAGPGPNRRKSQGTPSPTPMATKVERAKPDNRSSKVDRSGMKQRSKDQDVKKPQLVTKNTKPTKPKNMTASVDDSVTTPAKPSFYNKVTKKGSVVPLETKPFLRKGTGMGPSIGGKAKTAQLDESSKTSGNLAQDLEKDVVGKDVVDNGVTELSAESRNLIPAENPVVAVNNEINLQVPENNDQTGESKITPEVCPVESVDTLVKTEEFPVEIQLDEESGISASAWVEVDPPELPELHENGHTPPKVVTPEPVGPVTISSPRVRHSLSQMLQAENGESEIIEWGNAENPPALVYQKESPKGLKRLLKFARKSKGEANSTGWASPSVFSEGEDDAEEAKGVGRKHADALLRKAALQAKGGAYDDRSLNRMIGMVSREMEGAEMNISNLPVQGSNKRGQTSTTTASNKGTRSFFSLSTFRSSKSETKLR
ncbi:hypothetical protein H6P81_014714 [Aristolochia fimbriata]|uniref:COP1-interacting protein 7 n=1 Tax=Aristolochia fimbriata TaxID=158543 RepID=A0AAV7E3H8_ARIFI|nr:hypothetical protein H6P81_014714 [Aristolochia fimbriata]